MIKISKTSKLDNIKSWSLQAVDTCPGSADGKGGLVDACKGCYATTGMYNFSTVKAPRLHNQEDRKRDKWVADMVASMKKAKFFRWFDSGDVYDLKLARKIYQVMQQTPHVQHWFPTRMMKFSKFQATLNGMQELPNVMVRFSSDAVDGSYTVGVHGSCIVSSSDADTDAKICTAPLTDGKCDGCRACYDKSVPVIAYVAHGFKMRKVININAI
jgi:hypothetical protein